MTEQTRWSGDAGLVRLGDTVVPERVTLTRDSEDDDGPHLTAVFEVRHGRPECVSLAVTSTLDGRGIRLSDINVFTLDATAVQAFERWAVRAEHTGSGAARMEIDIADFGGRDDHERWAARADLHEARTASRGALSRAELERVARVYREHIDHQPTKAVGLILGYTQRTAARRVEQARAAGLLPPTTPGKPKA